MPQQHGFLKLTLTPLYQNLIGNHLPQELSLTRGESWGQNAENAIKGLQPECLVIRFSDLDRRPINWPDLSVVKHPQRLHAKNLTNFSHINKKLLMMLSKTLKTMTVVK